MVCYGMVEVFEGAPVAMGGWVLTVSPFGRQQSNEFSSLLA